MKPNIIKIYAREINEKARERVTEQGFGVFEKLGSPRSRTFYVWEGLLHGLEKYSVGYGGKVVNCTNSRESLEDLAQNLSENIRKSPSVQHNQANIPAYKISYDVPKTEQKHEYSTVLSRPLNFIERIKFTWAMSKFLRDSNLI